MDWQSRRLGGCALGSISVVRCEQCQRLKVDPAGDLLHGLQRQIALASLDASHVGPVNAEQLGERLLAKAAFLAVDPQVSANSALKIALHFGEQSSIAT